LKYSLLGLFLAAGLLRAQTTTAQITGRISDPSDAVVAAASVRVTNTDTGIVRETLTSSAGYYTAPLLQPGPYEIAVQVSGFKPMVRTGVTLQVDQVARIDFRLELGAANESVTVQASAPLLDAATGSLGQLIENRQITELPTNGRNTLAFVALTPGVRMQGNAGLNPYTVDSNGRGNFSINGGVSNGNEVLVDGAPVTISRSNAPGYLPPVDATQEFRVEASSYSAEYGRSSGGVVNLSIKAGTNRFHGTLYEFLRNSSLDANNFYQNKAGLPKLPLKQHQYGASTGGPIRRDRTFFFASWEGFAQRQGVNLTTTVPTALQRAGDFSQTFTAAGQLIVIADPNTTRQNADGTFARTAYASNRIPAAQIDPVAAKFAAFYWPLPNQPGAPGTGTNNLSVSASAPFDAQQGLMRIDHSLGIKWKMFGTYAQQSIDRGTLDFFHNKATPGAPGASGVAQLLTTDNAVLAATAVLNPRWILELRSAFIRAGQDRTPPNVPFDLAGLGFPKSYADAVEFKTVPNIQVPGVQGVGTAAFSVLNGRSNNWTQSASVTWVRGSQTIKFGGSYRLMQANDVNGGSSAGQFNFTAQFTSTNPQAATATSGVALASFFLGSPATGQVDYSSGLAHQRWYMSSFLQDDWKVTRRLTLNLGIQYSIDTEITERFNRAAWFDPNAVPPVAQTVGLPLLGGLQFVSSDNRSPSNLFLKQWAPRFGFALQAHANTVVRGGYGIFWLPNNLYSAATNTRSSPWSTSTQFVGSLDNGITPHDKLSNPFPNGIQLPPGSSKGLNSLLGQDISVYLRDNHAGYAQQWNLDIQQGLWRQLVVDIAYAGSRGTGLPVVLQFNQLPVQYMSLGTQLTQQVPNPFFGLVQTGTLANRTVTRSQLLRPFPQFGSISSPGASAGSSTYHSMQLKVTKRFSSSVLAAAYTISKAIGNSESATPAQEPNNQPGAGAWLNNYDHRVDRSLAEFDVPQRLVVSYTVNLPFGKGRRLLTKTGPLNRLIAGWEVSGIYTAQSGTPIFLSTSQVLTNNFVTFSRPNNNGHSAELSGDPRERLNRWFDTSVFSQPAPFTFGNVGRTLPDVRNHGINNLDFGLFKNNPFGRDGRLNLQFRSEFFNVMNHAQFANPGLAFGTAQFGVISAQANFSRQVQLALKLIF
jgi:hypothetical protein